MSASPMKLALTIDDAPMLLPDLVAIPSALPDPAAMDRVRDILVWLGVERCVAFVVGAAAERDMGPLERWLGAGFELGNHTYEHIPARECGVVDFMASVERCDALLARVGAFADGRRRWFRFPQLSYGADAGARRDLRTALARAGYRIAHASTDLYDHAYEGAFGRALRDRDEHRCAAIQRRFHRSALFSLRQSRRRIERQHGAGAPLVVYAHFGRVCLTGLAPLIEALRRDEIEWCSLDEALQHPLYRRMDDDADATGLATAGLPRSLAWRSARKLARAAQPLSDLWTERAGPLLPALVNE